MYSDETCDSNRGRTESDERLIPPFVRGPEKNNGADSILNRPEPITVVRIDSCLLDEETTQAVSHKDDWPIRALLSLVEDGGKKLIRCQYEIVFVSAEDKLGVVNIEEHTGFRSKIFQVAKP